MKNETTESEIRATFDKMIAETPDPDLKAGREFLREFFCNAEFRQAMSDEIARINGIAR